MLLQTFDSSYFDGTNIFRDDVFQNMFDYQPFLNAWELKRREVYWMLLAGNQNGHIIPSIHHYIALLFLN